MENQIVSYNPAVPALKVQDVIQQVNAIQEVMKQVMRENEHYGVIPGTKKPSLLKPGAEKLGLMFRLGTRYSGEENPRDLGNDHREYIIKCTLFHIGDATIIGEGLGSCSTKEGKYRYRGGEKSGTGKPVPKEYWNLKNAGKFEEAKKIIGGEGFGAGKIDGHWEICEIGEKVEHDNPADNYNTVLKMAKKRAHIDAILSATAASDIFTQDVEDIVDVEAVVVSTKQPTQAEPEKQEAKEADTSGRDDTFRKTIAALKAKLTEEEFKGVLLEFKVENEIELVNGKRNLFIIQLGKRLKMKEVAVHA